MQQITIVICYQISKQRKLFLDYYHNLMTLIFLPETESSRKCLNYILTASLAFWILFRSTSRFHNFIQLYLVFPCFHSPPQLDKKVFTLLIFPRVNKKNWVIFHPRLVCVYIRNPGRYWEKVFYRFLSVSKANLKAEHKFRKNQYLSVKI